MSQSAKDALERLKVKIESSISETKNYIRGSTSREDFALALELSIKVDERKDIIYTIDEMLNELEKEEKHTHKWDWQPSGYYRCGCGAILTRKRIDEYMNKWEKELDRKQEIREYFEE